MADKIITAGIEIQAGVSGTKDISNLSAELKAMGVDTRELDEKSHSLAASFRQLAQQQQLINQFKSLKKASQENADALDKQQAAVQRLAAQMKASPSKKLAADFERAKDSAKRLKAKQMELRNALHASRKALNDNGISSKKLAAAQTRLNEKTRFLSQHTQSVAEHLKRTRNELNKTASATERASRSSDKTSKSFGGISGKGGAAAAAVAAVAIATKKAVDEFVRIDAKFDRMERAFTEVTGSSAGATVEMQRLIDISNRLGITFSDIADDYTGFLASAKGANIEFDQSSEIFEKTAQKLLSMGKSTDEVGGVLLAFSQILSKGKVSTEELNQVAERLPGAFKLAADSVGLTTSEFRKMVEKGELLASDFLPKFADQLTVTANAQETNAQTNAKLANQWDLFVKSLDNTLGVSDGVQATTQALTSTLEFLTIETDESREATRKANEEYAKQQEAQRESAKAAVEAAEAAKQQKAANDANLIAVAEMRQKLQEMREQGLENTVAFRELDAQLNKSLVSAINYVGELNKAGNILDNAATEARKTREAFDAVGLSLNELTTGITDSEQKIIDGFGTAIDYINRTASSSQEAGDAMERYLVAAAAKIKSPEGLKALLSQLEAIPNKTPAVETAIKAVEDSVNKSTEAWVELTGAIKKATDTQQIQAFKAKAKEAYESSNLSLKQYTASLKEADAQQAKINKANQDKLIADGEARRSTEKTTAKTKESTAATKEATEADLEAVKAKEAVTDSAGDIAAAIGIYIDETRKSLSESERAVEHFDALLKRLWTSVPSSMYLDDLIDEVAERTRVEVLEKYRNTIQEIADATDLLNSKNKEATYTLRDIEDAASLTTSSLYILNDESQLDGLNAAIDKARQKMADLAQTAKDRVEDYKAQLARLKGDDSASLELEHKRKLRKLEEELADAKAHQNEEQIQALRETIRLEKEIYDEKVKRYEEDKKREAEREAQREKERAKRKDKDAEPSKDGSSKDAGTDIDNVIKNLPPVSVKTGTNGLVQTLVDKLAQRDRELAATVAKQVENNFVNQLDSAIKGRGY